MFTTHVKQLYWSNSGLPGKEGLNYKSDPAAAEKVLPGTLPVTVAGGGGTGFWDEGLLESMRELHTPYAARITELISSMPSHNFVYTAFDEMVPLLLHFPELFSEAGAEDKPIFRTPSDVQGLRVAALKISKW